MNWSLRLSCSPNRSKSTRFGVGPVDLSNRFDDHGMPGREDYSVVLQGTGDVLPFVGGVLRRRFTPRVAVMASGASANWKSRAVSTGSCAAAAFSSLRAGVGASEVAAWVSRWHGTGQVFGAAWKARSIGGGDS